MRMRQIAEKTGLSPATINYYFRLGLLPPRDKPTRNSALYTDQHVQRLLLIRRLRAEGDGLPLVAIRRIIELVDQGVEPTVAIALHRAVVGDAATASVTWSADDAATSRADLARKSGLTPKRLRALLDAKVIVPGPGPGAEFDGMDVHAAKVFAQVLDRIEASPRELGEISAHIFAASAKEMEIRNRASHALDPQAAAVLTNQLTEVANFWHAYLFMRARQQGIAIHGLGLERTKRAGNAAHKGQRRR